MDLERCIKALRATHDNKEEAANRLLTGGSIEEIEDVEAPSMLLRGLSSRYRRTDAVSGASMHFQTQPMCSGSTVEARY
jgi:hypothetical protein